MANGFGAQIDKSLAGLEGQIRRTQESQRPSFLEGLGAGLGQGVAQQTQLQVQQKFLDKLRQGQEQRKQKRDTEIIDIQTRNQISAKAFQALLSDQRLAADQEVQEAINRKKPDLEEITAAVVNAQGRLGPEPISEDPNLAFKREQLAEQRRQFDLKLKQEQADTGIELTPGQKKLDQDFAKDFSSFIAQGGFADTQKSISQLQRVIDKLEGLKDPETGKRAPGIQATGKLLGFTPKAIRDVITPEGADAQDLVEEIVQRNLRLVLGAQFTEKEGTRLIERSFNPRLSEEVNVKRLKRLLKQIRGAANARVAAGRYFERNGTLKGFKGVDLTNISSVNQLDNAIPPSDDSSSFQIGDTLKDGSEILEVLPD